MFKRFQVYDLYYPINDTIIEKWHEEKKELPKVKDGVFKVKLSTGDEIWAYFCRDQCEKLLRSSNMAQGKKTYMPTYWWSKTTHKPLYDVMYWGNMIEEKENE